MFRLEIIASSSSYRINSFDIPLLHALALPCPASIRFADGNCSLHANIYLDVAGKEVIGLRARPAGAGRGAAHRVIHAPAKYGARVQARRHAASLLSLWL